ncbi:hypothetical protein IWX84_001438 [Flavobacterium sp. CG_9.10]|uniref:T9SS type A sorting domain-containing protein n=1 Tax=Flavobacterium sp. CG_9.10 TaxID=2787729 RepID=UPI0018C9C055|nr:T9SS type A sorting domain-containing protein [Flavobacterium sp. CG_9.10]MBG6110559.1 hypothetical protein [Flavobacterium sp. CG_9.10]
MKKTTLFIIALLLSKVIIAQPVLNASDVILNYSAVDYYGDASRLSPGGAGPNQVWDFSSVSLTTDGTTTSYSTIPINTAPFAVNFPTANYCFKFTNNATPPVTLYGLYKISPTSLEEIADVDNTTIYVDYTPNPYTLFTFPYAYNTVISDTYTFTGDPTIYTNNSIYDAYGTLKTPFSTYSNVIRKKITDYDGSVSYDWYATNPLQFIMSADYSTPSCTTCLYIAKITTLGINKIRLDSKINVYPNPTSHNLNIQLPDNIIIDKIIITDLTGKIVKEQTQSTNNINVETLATGEFIIQVRSGINIFQSKFIKN